MIIRVPVKRTSTWGYQYGSEKSLDGVARLYTTHPQFVRLVRIEPHVDDGLTTEYALLDIDPEFPESEGFVAAQWHSTSQIIACGGGDGTMDFGMFTTRQVTHEVVCAFGNPECLEGRDFQTAFYAWLEYVEPDALRFLQTSPRTSRRISLASWLRQWHWWTVLAYYLRLRGTAIGKIGERVRGKLDERTYGLVCIDHLAPVRIAQALGFTPVLGEPEPWEGLLDCQEVPRPVG
ncbi:MAG: hypothetical protein KDD66_03040 [Bdellovibrionales bacterium]|nr:hypothetical protein [Bdellovibrionales bacterium]